MHLGRVVDRPHVDRQVAGVGRRQEQGVTSGIRPWRTGTWTQAAVKPPAGRCRAAATSRATWRGAHRRAGARPQGRLDAGQPPVGERAEAHPVERAGPPHQVHQRVDRRVVLGIDVDPHVGPGREQVLQQGDALAAGPSPPHLGPRQVADHARCGR